jgi:tRNA threonylcarbamoyladenosine biosynthesis protein TsaB
VTLAIDITTPIGSLALTRNGHLLEEFTLEAPTGFGEIIFAAIDGLLKRHSATIHDVSLIAVATGPGTFTGVRMGLTLAQGLAEALNIPVCGVSNLKALAHTGTGPERAPVLDARRGQHYTAIYNESGELIEPERLQTLEEFTPGVPVVHQSGPLAAAIAAIAAVAKTPQDPAALDANYIRRSDAELNLTVRPLSPPRT